MVKFYERAELSPLFDPAPVAPEPHSRELKHVLLGVGGPRNKPDDALGVERNHTQRVRRLSRCQWLGVRHQRVRGAESQPAIAFFDEIARASQGVADLLRLDLREDLSKGCE